MSKNKCNVAGPISPLRLNVIFLMIGIALLFSYPIAKDDPTYKVAVLFVLGLYLFIQLLRQLIFKYGKRYK